MKSIAPWMRPQDLVAPDPARGFLQKLLVRQWIHSALLMAALLWMSSTLDPASARAEVSVSVDPTAQVPAAPACPEVPILSLSLACSVTTLLSAQATVTCSGETIHAFTTGTCNLPTRALLEVTQSEPVAPESPGLPLVFRGTVRNAGPVAVTQVVVLHNRTGAGPLLEIPRLLPGESRSFSGDFPTPVNACRVFGTVSAAAIDACSGQRVFDSSTLIHALPGHPQLSVAKTCPSGPLVLAPGEGVSVVDS